MEFHLVQFDNASAQLETPAHRSAAEAFFLEFRKSQTTACCLYILEHTANVSSQFHAALSLKPIAVREYKTLGKDGISSLKSHLVEFMKQRIDVLQNVVVMQLALVVAVVFKRGWIEESDAEKQTVFALIVDLIGGGSAAKYRRIGFMLLTALVSEFSSEKASAIGLPWDFHNQCKKTFENTTLIQMFEFTLGQLRPLLENVISSGADPSLLKLALGILDQILSWEFCPEHAGLTAGTFERKSALNLDTTASITVTFPETWRNAIIRQDVLDTLFHVYHAVSNQPDLSHIARQCLVHLASIQGPIFTANLSRQESSNARKAFIGHYSALFLDYLSRFLKTARPQDDDPELTGITDIMRRLFTNHKLDIIGAVPCFNSLVEHIYLFTAACIQKIATSNTDEGDDSSNMIAIDELLDTWSFLILHAQIFLEDSLLLPAHERLIDLGALNRVLSDRASMLFENYFDARLELAKVGVLEELSDDIEDDTNTKDYELYSDQLVNVAALARSNPLRCMKKVHDVLTAQFAKLQQVFLGQGHQDASSLAVLHEHIHWTVLMSAFVLADNSSGETPTIPRTIMDATSDQACLQRILGTIETIFSICNQFSVELNSPKMALCSPLVTETIFWFLNRFTRTYLYLDPGNYQFVSNDIMNTFGKTGSGLMVLEKMLEMVNKNIQLWNSDGSVLLQIVRLFDTLSKNQDIRNALVESSQFNSIVMFCLTHLNAFPASIHSPLIQSIVVVATHTSNLEVRAHYFSSLSLAIEKQFTNIINRADFMQIYQTPKVLDGILNSLETFSGLALATDPSNIDVTFTVCNKYMDSFTKLLEVYKDFTQVEEHILLFYRHLTASLTIEKFAGSDVASLLSNIVNLFKTFSANNKGKKVRADSPEEEELTEHLSMMLDIMSNLLSLVNGESRKLLSSTSPSLAEVVFFGVDCIIPIISAEMLKYMKLCKDYMKLISLLFALFPEKIGSLPPELLSSLMKSIEFGMGGSFEISKFSLEALIALGSFAKSQRDKQGATSTGFLNQHLDNFLGILLNLLLLQEFDSYLFDDASESLYWLVILRQGTYATLIHQLVQQQDTPSFKERLSEAVMEFNQSLHETVIANPSQESAHIHEYRNGLMRFLINARGFLRIK